MVERNLQQYKLSIVIPVYKPRERERIALGKILQVVNDIENLCEVILVNDSGCELPSEYLNCAKQSEMCRIIGGKSNQGRSQAINLGVSQARGDVLWILDADCWPRAEALGFSGEIDWSCTGAVIGSVETIDNSSFWNRYLKERRTANNTVSTANMLIRKELYQSIGGFSEDYHWYGFEDQDFLIRLSGVCNYRVNKGFTLVHCDELALNQVRRKMSDAALSGLIFKRRYPEQYLRMTYSKVDIDHMSPIMFLSMNLASMFVRSSYPTLEYIVEGSKAPFFLKSMIVLLVSAVSYFDGCGRRKSVDSCLRKTSNV